MPDNQFDNNVNNGVAIVVDNDVYIQLSGWKYTPAFLTYQNHCYMSILNPFLYLMTIHKIVLIF